jgi:hypothetical protein
MAQVKVFEKIVDDTETSRMDLERWLQLIIDEGWELKGIVRINGTGDNDDLDQFIFIQKGT